MGITRKMIEAYNIVIIDGELDLTIAPRVKDFLNRAIDEGETNLIIDISDVDYIDSSGIGVLLTTLKRIEAKHGRLILLSIPPSIEDLFNKTKLTSYFKLAKEISDLPAMLKGKSG